MYGLLYILFMTCTFVLSASTPSPPRPPASPSWAQESAPSRPRLRRHAIRPHHQSQASLLHAPKTRRPPPLLKTTPFCLSIPSSLLLYAWSPSKPSTGSSPKPALPSPARHYRHHDVHQTYLVDASTIYAAFPAQHTTTTI